MLISLTILLSSCGFAMRDKNILAFQNNEIGTQKEKMLQQLAEPNYPGFNCNIIQSIIEDENGLLEACNCVITIDGNRYDDYVYF